MVTSCPIRTIRFTLSYESIISRVYSGLRMPGPVNQGFELFGLAQ